MYNGCEKLDYKMQMHLNTKSFSLILFIQRIFRSDKMLKLSVIIPIYNVAEHLERSLESILMQNYSNYEIILVNDGSTDNSGEICEDYRSKHAHIKVIHQKNQGSGVARNIGMDIAKGEYLFFCDPDDYLNKHFFKAIDKYIKNEPEIIIFSYWDVYERKDGLKQKELVSNESDYLINRTEFREAFADLFSKNMLYTLWNKVYNTEFLFKHQIRFQEISMGQDTRFNLEVYPHVSKVQLVKEPYYNYVKGRSDSSTTKYRENRTDLQLEEVRLLEGVLKQFNQKEDVLIKTIKRKILLENSHRIAVSGLSKKRKIELINQILSKEEFQEIIFDKKEKQSLSLRLFKNNRVKTYLALKTIESYFA